MNEQNQNDNNKFTINPVILFKDLKDAFAMFFSAIRGKFKIRPSSICWTLLGLAYIIIPIDFIPEAVLNVIGLGDDLVVFVYILNQVRPDIERFRQFRLAKKENDNEKSL